MLHGRILTPDGLRFLCASLDNDPEKIGKHMLEMLAKFRSEGLLTTIRIFLTLRSVEEKSTDSTVRECKKK